MMDWSFTALQQFGHFELMVMGMMMNDVCAMKQHLVARKDSGFHWGSNPQPSIREADAITPQLPLFPPTGIKITKPILNIYRKNIFGTENVIILSGMRCPRTYQYT